MGFTCCGTLVLRELELLAAAKCWISEKTEQSETMQQFTTAYFYLAELWHLLLKNGSHFICHEYQCSQLPHDGLSQMKNHTYQKTFRHN